MTFFHYIVASTVEFYLLLAKFEATSYVISVKTQQNVMEFALFEILFALFEIFCLAGNIEFS